MKPIRWLIAFLLLASTAWAANPKLSVAVDAQGNAAVTTDLGKGTPCNFQALDLGGERRLLLLTWVDGQRARLAIYDYAFKDFQPGPQPEPVPPDPVPPVPPDPVSHNLRVLFLYESAALGTMTAKQSEILTSPKVRDYLKKKCPTEGGEKTPSFRFLDDDSDLSRLPVVWKNTATVLKSKVAATPSVLIATEKGEVFSGAWPDSVDACLTLLRKYGGPE